MLATMCMFIFNYQTCCHATLVLLYKYTSIHISNYTEGCVFFILNKNIKLGIFFLLFKFKFLKNFGLKTVNKVMITEPYRLCSVIWVSVATEVIFGWLSQRGGQAHRYMYNY